MAGNIENGRIADPGEIPWTVYILLDKPDINIKNYQATGVILNSRWVLTAGHVVNCKKRDGTVCWSHNIRVYPGLQNVADIGRVPAHTSHTYFIPDNYVKHKWDAFDIGMLKLNEPIQFANGTGHRAVNGVCLPRKGVYNRYEEYAVMAGFGKINNGVNTDRLRMGWSRLMRPFNNQTDRWREELPVKYDHGATLCAGDSGGPLIQYVDGVAVLIGISRGVEPIPTAHCKVQDPNKRAWFTRVSLKIDWIIGTVANFSTP